MLLRCEDGNGESMEPGGGMPAGPGWLRAETLACVAELNEMSLALLAEQAAARPAQVAGPLARVPDLLRHLDAAARRRAAGCPYLLLDAGFGDLRRWQAVAAGQVADGEGCYTPFFTVAAALEAARLVLTYAWHLARTQPAAARLLLGMPQACAIALGGCGLRQVYALAECHPEWLRPRWQGRTEVWQELLAAAAAGEDEALQRARLHGLTLLAAEARHATERPVRF